MPGGKRKKVVKLLEKTGEGRGYFRRSGVSRYKVENREHNSVVTGKRNRWRYIKELSKVRNRWTKSTWNNKCKKKHDVKVQVWKWIDLEKVLVILWKEIM